MTECPNPTLRLLEKTDVIGAMAVYGSQAEASLRIPQQWQRFRLANLPVSSRARLVGASPCTPDQKIHYLTGVEQGGEENVIIGDLLTLEAGEYAVVEVNDAALLRGTWTYLLGTWLPASGRRERSAPEFERYTSMSEFGEPTGPVEIWIPLEPIEN